MDEEAKNIEITGETDSARVHSFNKAINVYVESLFDEKNFANVVVRSFIPFYAKDETLKEKAISAGAGVKDNVCQNICEVVDVMKVENSLKALEEKTQIRSRKQFAGVPEKQLKSELYKIKKKHLLKLKQTVDDEYDVLAKQLEEEVEKLESKKKDLQHVCIEKDKLIHTYTEKIQEIDQLQVSEFLENNKISDL